MSYYRRANTLGGTYFFTLVTYRRWQRRYWEHLIRDEIDYEYHMDYIHFNPVKHGHVISVNDWPFSTYHRYVRHGVYTEDWGGETDINVGDNTFGEPR